MDEPLSPEVLHALANPLRLAALVALEERGRAPADLAAALGVGEPELMEHLHLLEAGGLVEVDSGTGTVQTRSAGWTEIVAQLARLQHDAGDER